MWSLTPPSVTVDGTLSACLVGMQSVSRRAAFEAERANLVDAEERFIAAAELELTHSLDAQDFATSMVSKDDAVWVYDQRLARAQRAGTNVRPGRAIYDDIVALRSSLNDRCPLCNHRIATELDHFVPKAVFHALTICPFNLVPCCSECNATKHNSVASTADDEFIHPYTSDLDNEVWLAAQVSPTAAPLIEFWVEPPSSWTAETANRATSHFSKYKLSTLYTIESASRLNSLRSYFERVHASGGSSALSEDLQSMADSYRDVATNSWEAAMYEALAADDDFCAGLYGFSPAG